MTLAEVLSMLKEQELYNEIYFYYSYNRTSRVEVEYIDYNVARSIIDLVSDWHKTLQKAKINWFVKALKKKQKILIGTSRNIIVAASTISLFLLTPIFIPQNADLSLLVKFLLACFALIFASFQIGGVIGRAATKLVNRYTYLGYIKLNKADEILIRDTIERNDKSLIKLIANFSAQLIIGLLTSLASFYLTYK